MHIPYPSIIYHHLILLHTVYIRRVYHNEKINLNALYVFIYLLIPYPLYCHFCFNLVIYIISSALVI